MDSVYIILLCGMIVILDVVVWQLSNKIRKLERTIISIKENNDNMAKSAKNLAGISLKMNERVNALVQMNKELAIANQTIITEFKDSVEKLK